MPTRIVDVEFGRGAQFSVLCGKEERVFDGDAIFSTMAVKPSELSQSATSVPSRS